MVLGLFLLLLLFFVVLPIVGTALWTLFTTVLIGLVIGALARLIVPGYQRIGFIGTVLSGLCGAIFGGYLGSRLFHLPWFGTTLLQIGVAAVVVAVFQARTRQPIG